MAQKNLIFQIVNIFGITLVFSKSSNIMEQKKFYSYITAGTNHIFSTICELCESEI